MTSKMLSGDYQERLNFPQWFKEKVEVNPVFVDWISFTDDANFYADGSIKTHNCVICGKEKPSRCVEESIPSTKVMV